MQDFNYTTSQVNQAIGNAINGGTIQVALSSKADLFAGKVPTSQLPQIAITSSVAVSSADARLALTPEEAEGNIVIESDTGHSYMLVIDGLPNNPDDWLEISDHDVDLENVTGLPNELSALHATDNDLQNQINFKSPLSALMAEINDRISGDSATLSASKSYTDIQIGSINNALEVILGV